MKNVETKYLNKEILMKVKEELKKNIPLVFLNLFKLSHADFIKEILKDKIEYSESESSITESYLDFLKLQIELNARGDSWSDILRKRYKVLSSYIGKKYYNLNIGFQKNEDLYETISITILSENNQILYIETY